jgi:hypothetical protein
LFNDPIHPLALIGATIATDLGHQILAGFIEDLP